MLQLQTMYFSKCLQKRSSFVWTTTVLCTCMALVNTIKNSCEICIYTAGQSGQDKRTFCQQGWHICLFRPNNSLVASFSCLASKKPIWLLLVTFRIKSILVLKITQMYNKGFDKWICNVNLKKNMDNPALFSTNHS